MKMKKGTYYLGDPCYIFDKSWSDIVHEANFFMEECKVRNKICFGGSTAYGDGSYHDNFGRKYFVDAGLIAILPISLINIDKIITRKEIKESEGMHIITFDEDFYCNYDNGIFEFGNIIINTKNEKEDEDD